MTTTSFRDIPNRYALSNELHARPFPNIAGPGRAFCMALKSPDGSPQTRDAETKHLLELLDRFGAHHPPEGANHYYGKIGRDMLKWERHSEFLTYSVFTDDLTGAPFTEAVDLFPETWAQNAPGEVVTASQLRIGVQDLGQTSKPDAVAVFKDWFESESLAVASVLDNNAIVASDFRIDSAGFVRFAIIVDSKTGSRRLGRIVQRLFEIETYKSMAMLSLPAARSVSTELADISPRLSSIVRDFSVREKPQDEALTRLLDISARLENLSAENASRFSAAKAYSAIVNQRIEVLRETRVGGRQIFAEFMMRRFDPAMRTCASTSNQLSAIIAQAARAGEMLRTQTDVARAEQNQAILSRMDERADQQLNLQKTVEGLSVVAVSYYAVNLVGYLLAPLSKGVGLSKTTLTALITLPVIALVWAMIRKIRNHF